IAARRSRGTVPRCRATQGRCRINSTSNGCSRATISTSGSRLAWKTASMRRPRSRRLAFVSRSPLVGALDLVERDADGRVIVVDLKTSARKYTDLQAEQSLQLSIYSYVTSMNGLGDQDDLRLRFDVLTKTKQPELHRYWTQRDRAASVRLFRLVAEVLQAIEARVFHPNPGWQCKDCQFRSRCWAWRETANTMAPGIPASRIGIQNRSTLFFPLTPVPLA